MTTPDMPPLPKLSLLCRFMPDDYRYGDVFGFTADQMRAYAAAAVLAEQKKAERLRAKLQEIGDFAASCATGPGLREALAMIEQMVAAPGEQQP